MSQEAAVSTERPEELAVISVDDHCGLLTQHGSAGAPIWTLASAPATQLGFQVLALSLPIVVTPKGCPAESSIFLLPYTEGQIESLLQLPMARAGGKGAGLRLTTGTTRMHDQLSSLRVELDLQFPEATVNTIWAGPGGIGPIDWCVKHGITDPLSNPMLRRHYYRYFGVCITAQAGGVHPGSVYYSFYNFWKPSEVLQFIEGVEVTAA